MADVVDLSSLSYLELSTVLERVAAEEDVTDIQLSRQYVRELKDSKQAVSTHARYKESTYLDIKVSS